MMPLRFLKFITRADLKADPNGLYLFGDNDQRVGMGGQAGAMRGEPNAIGVRTKLAPSMNEWDFFSDDFFEDNCHDIDEDLERVRDALKGGISVICPSDGLGTGLSELPTRAPRTFAYLHISLQLLQCGIFETPAEFARSLKKMKALKD